MTWIWPFTAATHGPNRNPLERKRFQPPAVALGLPPGNPVTVVILKSTKEIWLIYFYCIPRHHPWNYPLSMMKLFWNRSATRPCAKVSNEFQNITTKGYVSTSGRWASHTICSVRGYAHLTLIAYLGSMLSFFGTSCFNSMTMNDEHTACNANDGTVWHDFRNITIEEISETDRKQSSANLFCFDTYSYPTQKQYSMVSVCITLKPFALWHSSN